MACSFARTKPLCLKHRRQGKTQKQTACAKGPVIPTGPFLFDAFSWAGSTPPPASRCRRAPAAPGWRGPPRGCICCPGPSRQSFRRLRPDRAKTARTADCRPAGGQARCIPCRNRRCSRPGPLPKSRWSLPRPGRTGRNRGSHRRRGGRPASRRNCPG